MKVFHFSDTHLGIGLENTAREEDFYKNFELIINEILKTKPEIVVHSGDLFHTSRPSNRAISVVMQNFLKLERAGVKTIIVAGNHDTPRLSLTTHPFEIFEGLQNFYVFYKQEIKQVEISGVNFVALPHIHDEEIFKRNFKEIPNLKKTGKPNIFVSHFGISAREYDEYTDEISGVNVKLDQLEILKEFDYVALGHYHKQFSIGNIAYSGSIEHTSFNQRNYKIGYNIFDTDKKTKEGFLLPSRPMIDLGSIDCKNFEKTQDLIEYLEKNIDKKAIKDAILKVVIENITNKLMLEFDEKLFLNFFAEAFYFEYKKIKLKESKELKIKVDGTSNVILDNFEIFFDNYDFADKSVDKEKLKQELKDALLA